MPFEHWIDIALLFSFQEPVSSDLGLIDIVRKLAQNKMHSLLSDVLSFGLVCFPNPTTVFQLQKLCLKYKCGYLFCALEKKFADYIEASNALRFNIDHGLQIYMSVARKVTKSKRFAVLALCHRIQQYCSVNVTTDAFLYSPFVCSNRMFSPLWRRLFSDLSREQNLLQTFPRFTQLPPFLITIFGAIMAENITDDAVIVMHFVKFKIANNILHVIQDIQHRTSFLVQGIVARMCIENDLASEVSFESSSDEQVVPIDSYLQWVEEKLSNSPYM
ncbi:hypothetical protein RCL1_004737 [Eukaryota sp. TZLM3-RCL]